MSEAIKPFIIENNFHAAPVQLYAALTEPDALGQWMGPKGCVLSVAKLEPHPGGMFLYSMQMPGGLVMWGKWIFEAMEPPHRLVVRQSFSDANGGITVHPMSPSWPRVMHSTTTLTVHKPACDSSGRRFRRRQSRSIPSPMPTTVCARDGAAPSSSSSAI
jgi:uncharacterized protein YndB with AHSA1/START domain